MTLPELNNWSATRDSLHQAALVLGATRKLLVERQPNFQHLSLGIVPNGLSTGETSVGEITLNFVEQSVTLDAKQGKDYKLILKGLSPALLRDTLVNALAETGQVIAPPREGLSQTPFEIHASQASDYAQVQYTLYTGIRKFWETLPNFKTPPVLWPHHFDISFLWFVDDGKDEHTDAHMNFGFSPYTEGIDEPYLYAYGWSQATGYIDIPTPPDTELKIGGSKYTVLKYSVLRQQADPIAFIQDHFHTLWQNTQPYFKRSI